jgi:hypothetical protein
MLQEFRKYVADSGVDFDTLLLLAFRRNGKGYLNNFISSVRLSVCLWSRFGEDGVAVRYQEIWRQVGGSNPDGN